MDRKTLSAAVLMASLLLAACASKGGKTDNTVGTRVLDCVIAQKEQDSAGSSGASGYRGTGNYYFVFETKEGEATAHYRIEVTRVQFQRFQEGDHVRITLNNSLLVDIRSLD